jgi:hypothetical protein
MTITTTEAAQAQRAVLAFAYDAGHAWLVVSLDSEHGFPKAMEFASRYSYVNLAGSNFAGDVYLEEDVDALAFVKTYGIELAFVQEHELPEGHAVRDWGTGSADPDVLMDIIRKSFD